MSRGGAGAPPAAAEATVERWLAALTPEEKLALLSGVDLWHTAAVARLGIPSLRLTDGPNGARGTHTETGPPSACFPVGVALAATWDVDLVSEVGAALAWEAADKGAQVLLAPTVNLHRHPLAGRNFECFSEDPLLSARMAVAYVRGVQSGGVAATVKHFVANDSEFRRYTMSSEVGERVLRELYLAPFEAAVTEGGAWAVMSAYNRLNGTPCAAHRWLLSEVLKEEWGFDGVVMSDWHGTSDTVGPARAGLDLEMPGPPRHFGTRLAEAVAVGAVPSDAVEGMARRVLRLVVRVGEEASGADAPEVGLDRPETWALARRAAAAGMVLLRNDGLLPLDLTGVRRVAVIGPNAHPGQIMGGGSSAVRPYRVAQPLASLTERLGPGVEVRHEPGCRIHRLVPALPDLDHTVEWFDRPEPAGEPVHVSTARRLGVPPGGLSGVDLDGDGSSVRWTATYLPEVSGPHLFGATAVGRVRVSVDGTTVVDGWSAPRPGHTFYGFGSAEERGDVVLDAGRPATLTVEYARGPGPFPAVRVGVEPPEVGGDLVERALGAARAADVAVVIVGTTGEWETEGCDRPGLSLPGGQDELVRAVLGVNRNTVVVVNAGAPVAMDWAEAAPALVYAWFPGMAFGEALADVLLGDVNPSGRLPTTFPRRLEDHPAYLNYPGEADRVVYGEGVFVGYRGFDARDIEPLFPFGHGLSYTRFAYGELQVLDTDPARHRAVVAVEVTNVGERSGAEVVQLYVADEDARVARPPKELRGFAKVHLEPGEAVVVRFELDERAFAFWDETAGGWTVEPGRFELLAGSSSRDLRSRITLIW